MKEIAVSLRLNFDAEGLTSGARYRMEQILADWLRRRIIEGDDNAGKALYRELDKASGKDIEEFYVFVLTDLTTATEDAQYEMAFAGQSN
jgi:hypothetical protein